MDRPGTLSLARPREAFSHEALFYADRDEFLAGTGAFVRDGLMSDEPVRVMLSPPKIEALRSELGAHSERVEFTDINDVGSNPARIIPAWRAFVDRHRRPGRRLRGIGEPISAERSPAELVECGRHESLLNLAFADTPGFRLLCPYDTAALDPDVLAEARRLHPFLLTHGVKRESPEYRGLDEAAEPFAEPLPEPLAQPESRVFQTGTLAALRDFVARRAAGAGFTGETTDDLVLAVDEVATNSVLHGGGGGILRIWLEGDELVCEVGDLGLIGDPMVGRARPTPHQAGGYGVWLANQLCDLVQVRTFAAGSAVRLRKRRG
jgi:anti-sigma regulatory factor (Ser/Thr protein kinase)